jgi:hypothetical protein
LIRQGDILFVPITAKPDDFTRNLKRDEKGLIAEGEATGHHHRVATEDLDKAQLFKSWRGVDGAILVVGEEIRVVHEEHHTVTLPPATYRIHQAREFDYFTHLSRPVID